jgi:hypothetical protein
MRRLLTISTHDAQRAGNKRIIVYRFLEIAACALALAAVSAASASASPRYTFTPIAFPAPLAFTFHGQVAA